MMGLSALGSIGGSALGGLIGGGDKPKVPQLPTIDPGDIQKTTAEDNLRNLSRFEELGRAVNEANVRGINQALELAMPGQLQQAKSNVAAQLRGEIPSDVAQQIARTSAAQGFRGGFQGGGLGRNLTARDLGLTSLQLQQQGLSNFGSLSQMAAPNPFNVSSMFFSPQQRLDFAMKDRNARFQRDMAAAGVAAMPSPTQSAIGQGISQFGQTLGQLGMFGAGREAGIFGNDAPMNESAGIPNILGGWGNRSGGLYG